MKAVKGILEEAEGGLSLTGKTGRDLSRDNRNRRGGRWSGRGLPSDLRYAWVLADNGTRPGRCHQRSGPLHYYTTGVEAWARIQRSEKVEALLGGSSDSLTHNQQVFTTTYSLSSDLEKTLHSVCVAPLPLFVTPSIPSLFLITVGNAPPVFIYAKDKMLGWWYAHWAPLICRHTNVDARYSPHNTDHDPSRN